MSTINSYEELIEWNKNCLKNKNKQSVEMRAARAGGGGGGEPEPPKQNTEEIGHWTTPVTEFHEKLADTMLNYVYLTSDYTRGMYMMDFAGEFGPNPNGLLQEKMPDGYWKIKGGLPPEEYRKLIGAQQWDAIIGRYEDEKYLVYDDQQQKDPATKLFPEFYLIFRFGCYISWNFKVYDGDNQPKLTLDFKSAKEYTRT